MVRAECLPDFGKRLTRDEYERRAVALHASGPAMPSKVEASKTRRAELDLLIDYHLGVAFPEGRRDALWQAQCKLDKRRGWHLIRGVVSHPSDPMAAMARAQVQAFARLLDADELRALLDLSAEDLQKFT